jgi:glycosyltransferase involved in cell wall biosynthesis
MTDGVSVGMPVYNGEKTIAKAIDSILSQSFQNIELIISDNNSTDLTEVICRRYCSTDSRIRYYRQTENHAVLKNFQYVLQLANKEYFLWNAADDFRTTSYIEENVKFLQANPLYLGSASPDCIVGQEHDPEQWIRFDVDGSCYDRIRKFMNQAWASPGIFYGVYRKEVLKKIIWPELEILATDWLIIATLLLEGPIARINEGLFVISRGGVGESKDQFQRFQHDVLDHIFPFQRYTRLLGKAILNCRKLTMCEKFLLILRLAKLNWNKKFLRG